MTLIAAIKYKNMGCVISDLRITKVSTGVQQDIALKYISFDNRLMLYMSGQTVSLLPLIQEALATVSNELSVENVDQEYGPLKTILSAVIEGKDKTYESSIIGIYVNEPSNSFKMFRVDIKYIDGSWEIEFIADNNFEWEVIGSGEILMQEEFFPNWHPFSLYKIFKNGLQPLENPQYKDYEYCLKTVGEVIQGTIKQRLGTLGKGIYKKLGISPVTSLSLISGSSLVVMGGNYEITRYETNKKPKSIKYSIQKELSNRVALTNQLKNETIKIHQTDSDFPVLKMNNNISFDPEEVEGEDIFYPPYTLSQQIFQLAPQDPISVIRFIRHTEYLFWQGHKIPVRKIIKTQKKECRYAEAEEINEYWLQIKDNNLQWDSIDLFSKSWINKYIGKNNPFTLRFPHNNMSDT
ncbi:hypothetical protein COE67_19845 [Priestia megaterium]|uniref:hypothetical protein n=1 Tax=Priestia megaterium TaxID=1404 RepID=UPI000BFCE42E|nr:hypothetical protein [Priestia megaterium]PGX34582.1 hypothetical protein COE67_19845 [Priestia megaterium]